MRAACAGTAARDSSTQSCIRSQAQSYPSAPRTEAQVSLQQSSNRRPRCPADARCPAALPVLLRALPDLLTNCSSPL